MYAIISDGSHQYRVEEGMVFDVERKELDEEQKSIEFDRVLLVGGGDDGVKLGQPTVDGAKVSATVIGEFKGEKLVIQKYRRRKDSRLKKGHRQKYMRVRIETIQA